MLRGYLHLTSPPVFAELLATGRAAEMYTLFLKISIFFRTSFRVDSAKLTTTMQGWRFPAFELPRICSPLNLLASLNTVTLDVRDGWF